jgi:hypothetical protein
MNQEYYQRYNQEYYQRNKEAIKEKSRKYYLKNRDNLIAKQAVTHKVWVEKNPERMLELRRKQADISRLRRYGVTSEGFSKMFTSQEGKCAICGRKGSSNGKQLCVDHDHTTKKVRELLCDKCNLVLGNAQESILILKAAILYLEKHAGTP